MTTSSGSKSATKSLAWPSAPSMSSSRSCDGPGRFRSGLWDMQHRASGTVSSRGQGEDVEDRGAQLGRELSDGCACDAAIGTQDDHGFLPGVEPAFQLAGTVADDRHIRIVVTGPVQLGLRARRDERGAQLL